MIFLRVLPKKFSVASTELTRGPRSSGAPVHWTPLNPRFLRHCRQMVATQSKKNMK